jgi:hypothetical protein
VSVSEKERYGITHAKLIPEEPDALIGHVRVCGGSGEVTPRFYPAPLGYLEGGIFYHEGAQRVHEGPDFLFFVRLCVTISVFFLKPAYIS